MLKVVLFILVCWFACGAANFLFIVLSKPGRKHIEKMPALEIAGMMAVVIVCGPISIIGGIIDYFKKKKQIKGN